MPTFLYRSPKDGHPVFHIVPDQPRYVRPPDGMEVWDGDDLVEPPREPMRRYDGLAVAAACLCSAVVVFFIIAWLI